MGRKSLKYKASVKMAGSLWTNPNDFSSKIVISESGVYSLVFGSVWLISAECWNLLMAHLTV